MSLKRLKDIRLVVSLVFLIIFGAFFLDFWQNIPVEIVVAVTAFQVGPAVLKTLSGLGLWTIGAAAIILITLLIGRVYCSSLCPLGTFQDFFIRLAKKRNKKRWFEYHAPRYGWHYAITAVTVVAALAGSMLLLDVLEPFSNFGRIVQGCVRPAVAGVNNLGAWLFGLFGFYWLAAIPLLGLSFSIVLIPLSFALLLAWLSYTRGRLFCNLLCPVGGLLSIAARFSLVKIVIDTVACRDCGLCEMVCKAQCIDAERKTVDYGACVSCFNCIKSCPTVGLKYESPFRRRLAEAEPVVSESRRALLKAAVVPALGLVQTPPDTAGGIVRPMRYLHPVTPPGSLGLEHFSQYCTACHLCVSECPTQVLVPSLFQYGIAGVFQPRMDYWVSYCNYDCKICSEVCPSGAILALPLEEKKLVQMGKAKFIKEDCIVITLKKDCGACSEHCPTKAVNMVPYENRFLPELKEEICIGCGACEHACPTTPLKAIYVEANVAHQRAEKPPKVKKLEGKPEGVEEFPF